MRSVVEVNTTNRKYLANRVVLAIVIAGAAALALFVGFRSTSSDHPEVTLGQQSEKSEPQEVYPMHKNITATVFWVGEDADKSNAFIHNRSSAWIEDWVTAYGGVDDPSNRCEHLPCGFKPKENPFYFALPYNDLDDKGNRKPSAKKIPWYEDVISSNPTSVVKNRWISITFNGRVAYAQWEDTGPFEDNDFDYVFGKDRPRSRQAGLDLSPATTSWLGINGRANVSWQFVKKSDVPDGPWRKTITKSN